MVWEEMVWEEMVCQRNFGKPRPKASTSFANPAVTLARSLTDTFAGIRPADAPGFVIAQLAGALVAAGADMALFPERRSAGK